MTQFRTALDLDLCALSNRESLLFGNLISVKLIFNMGYTNIHKQM